MNSYTFDQLFEGLEESFSVDVTKEQMDMFLAISGDTNPLHTNAEHAKSKGFKDCVVYGLLTSTFYSTLAGVHLPGRHCLLQGIDIKFVKPVFAGDILTVSGKVSYLNEAFKVAEIKAVIRNQNNVKVSSAKINVGVTDE